MKPLPRSNAQHSRLIRVDVWIAEVYSHHCYLRIPLHKNFRTMQYEMRNQDLIDAITNRFPELSQRKDVYFELS